MKKPAIGDVLWCVQHGIGRTLTVTKVGRTFFYCGPRRFFLDTWREEFSPAHVYESPEAYERVRALQEKLREFHTAVRFMRAETITEAALEQAAVLLGIDL